MRWGVQGQASQDRTGLGRRGLQGLSRVKVGGLVWDDLFSAKSNRGAEEGGGRWGGHPGAGLSPKPELVPLPSGETSELGSVEGRRGGREGLSLPTSRAWAEKQSKRKRRASWPQSLAVWVRHAGLGCPSPRCPAHSKVSHCFLSCSTEPGAGAGAGAGAGLTSCLVFRSKSSKGSLAS